MTAIEALLGAATFTRLHRADLGLRTDALCERLDRLVIRAPRRILLLNATLGLQFYPSMVDLFALLQQIQPNVNVTGASWFSTVWQLGGEVSRKGLSVCTPADALARADEFDVIVVIGACDALGELMRRDKLRAKLVYLDLGFYHQLIEDTGQRFLTGTYADPRRGEQRQRVSVWSVQPEAKLRADLLSVYDFGRFALHPLPYIPAGVEYGSWYSASEQAFDVALPGTDGRDFLHLDPALLRGVRFLFLGNLDRAPALRDLDLDLTVVPRVDEETYAKLLARCRCALLPLRLDTRNVLLSAVDVLASGLPLVTSRQAGFERLAALGAPLVFYDRPGAEDLAAKLRGLLGDEPARRSVGERSLAFVRDHLDIWQMTETILRAEVLS